MKKRSTSHVVDSTGEALLKRALPAEWVVRPYQPDYGIDFAVEVFDPAGSGFVTLGEYFFIQLKSHSKAKWVKKDVYARFNVAKAPLSEDVDKSTSISVIAETLDTAELQLARSMGPAAPLLLVVADIKKKNVHWICLNDFVDKVLIPETGNQLSAQASHTVHLPKFNRIERSDYALVPLRFMARRAKLYAAFNCFRYQRHEIQSAVQSLRADTAVNGLNPSFLHLAHHFLNTALAYDFWATTYAWPSVQATHIEVVAVAQRLGSLLSGESLESAYGSCIAGLPFSTSNKANALESYVTSELVAIFDKLANLGNMFEEICREWYLPTYLGTLAEDHAIIK